MASKISALKIIPQTNKLNTASVIFFHGSGDTGPGILDWIKFLIGEFPSSYIKFLFPTAPMRPYTPLGGARSHVWFDRSDITPDVPEHIETVEAMGIEVTKLIQQEVKGGIPLDRIIVGGFSMGGALALHTAYRFSPGLAGVFALSSFLNEDSAVFRALAAPGDDNRSAKEPPPLFMCHGDRDTLVPMVWGKDTYDRLAQFGIQGTFHPIKNTLHELKKQEILDLLAWIKKILPDEKSV